MSPSLAKKPTKPPSGYNIFYACESKRTRCRERAEVAYFHKVLSRSAESTTDGLSQQQPKSKNKTKFIGGKWKHLRPHSRELFAIRSRDELEIYHVDKMLWGVLDRLLANAGMSWDDDGTGAANGGGGGKNGKKSDKVDNAKPPGFPQELEPKIGGATDKEEGQDELWEGLMLFLV